MASDIGIVYLIYNTAINNNGAKSLELFNRGYDLLRYDLYSYITNAGYTFERDRVERSCFNLANMSEENLGNYRNYTKNYTIELDQEFLKTLYSSTYLPFAIVLYQTREERKEYLPVVTGSDLYDVRTAFTSLSVQSPRR